jgi:nicotinamidase-related amidase
MSMQAETTAAILVGFQNDYFASDGVVRAIVDDPFRLDLVLANTVRFLRRAAQTPVLFITTPILLRPDAVELGIPGGIIRDLAALGAFSAEAQGGDTVPEIAAFGDRIIEVPGKDGFNAFGHTALGDILADHGISDVVVAGVLTSLCIDSTGRAAYERGLRVTVLTDCTAGRTSTEHDFYCANIFPIYARTALSATVVEELTVQSRASVGGAGTSRPDFLE